MTPECTPAQLLIFGDLIIIRRNQQQQQQQQQQSASSVQQPPSVQQVGTPRSVPEPSPSPGWGGPPSHPMPTHHHMMPRQTAPPPPYSPSPYQKLDPPPSPPRPEANSLVVTVLLGDSALNIFRDHNFDSCTFCVCNAGPKVLKLCIMYVLSYFPHIFPNNMKN